MNALNVIRKPVITEKSSLLQEKKVYAFWINPKATKIDVKMAIRQIYGTDVAKVRILKVVGKFRAIKKGVINKRKETRKAYVTLADSAKLDLNKFEKSEKSTEVKLASSKSGHSGRAVNIAATAKTPKTSEAAKKTTKVKKTI